MTQYISGPVSCYKLESSENDKIIYLFGDIHEKLSYCEEEKKGIFLENIIEILNDNSDSIIDIFSETFLYDIKYKKSFIEQFNLYFKDCFNVPHTTCDEKYPNLRFHACDVRSNYLKLSDKDIWDDLFETEAKYTIYYDLIKSTFFEIYKEINFDSKQSIFEFESLCVDIYTLIRMFRSYSDGRYPDKIICYFGENHIKRISYFLENMMNYKLLYKSYEENPYIDLSEQLIQCIKVPKEILNNNILQFNKKNIPLKNIIRYDKKDLYKKILKKNEKEILMLIDTLKKYIIYLINYNKQKNYDEKINEDFNKILDSEIYETKTIYELFDKYKNNYDKDLKYYEILNSINKINNKIISIKELNLKLYSFSFKTKSKIKTKTKSKSKTKTKTKNKSKNKTKTKSKTKK